MKKIFILLLLVSMQVSSEERSIKEEASVSGMVLGACMPVDYEGGENNSASLAFGAYAGDYLVAYAGREDLRGRNYDKNTKVIILQQPKYGQLRHDVDSINSDGFAYIMEPNNHHDDEVVAQVEAFGYSIKVIVYLKPSQGGWDNVEEAAKTCPGSFDWKISATYQGKFVNEV